MSKFLSGLAKGMATTARTMTQHVHTQQYPHVHLNCRSVAAVSSPYWREKCTSCMLCARECTDWCIYIDSH